MKRLYVFAALALSSAILLVDYDLSKRMRARPEKKSSRVVASSLSALPVAIPQPDQPNQVSGAVVDADSESFFESKTLKQAQAFSLLQNDPKALDKKMDQLARGLSSLEIRRLAIVLHRKDESEDRRALAVELLSRSKTRDAVEMLKEFVGAPPKNAATMANRKREFESILRVQAIEGIAAYPKKELALSYLSSLEKQVDETFLKDRIVRSEEGLKGRHLNSQPKDEAVLKQLVQ